MNCTRKKNKQNRRGSELGGLEQGRAQVTGKFNTNDWAGEHRIGKHIYMRLMMELTRVNWELLT